MITNFLLWLMLLVVICLLFVAVVCLFVCLFVCLIVIAAVVAVFCCWLYSCNLFSNFRLRTNHHFLTKSWSPTSLYPRIRTYWKQDWTNFLITVEGKLWQSMETRPLFVFLTLKQHLGKFRLYGKQCRTDGAIQYKYS